MKPEAKPRTPEQLRVDLARLREALKWQAQTVHQAHHEGDFESCPRATCDDARRMLDET